MMIHKLKDGTLVRLVLKIKSNLASFMNSFSNTVKITKRNFKPLNIKRKISGKQENKTKTSTTTNCSKDSFHYMKTTWSSMLTPVMLT